VVWWALLLELPLPLLLVPLVLALVPLIAGPVGQQFTHEPIVLRIDRAAQMADCETSPP
jgi:hypothetical protein